MTHFFVTHGLPLLFVVVMLESFGLPLPGETALIAFGVLASEGHYSIVWVIVLPRAERIMARHGGKTVFFGRFVAVLRVGAAAVAGLAQMNWWRFLFWNASGGVVWATTVGLAAYYGGRAVADAIQRYGLYAAIVLVVALVGGWFVLRVVKHRVEDRL